MSVAHTAESPALRGGYITLDMITRPTVTANRRTKIIGTMGPASWSEEGLAKLIDAGLNVARFNFSHGDHAGHAEVLKRLRSVAEKKSRNIAILLDTKGPEIRTGFFANQASKIDLVKGQSITLTADYTFLGDSNKLACSYPELASSVQAGQQVLVADGSLVLTVLSTDVSSREILCRVENNVSIGERKNMNLPGVEVDLPTFTEKDVDDIVNFGIKHQVDYIAASFVRKASDVQNLRQLLADNGGQYIKIISKIENQEGLENYEAILQVTDAVMVARGDLGMEIPACKVFLAQKRMIALANIAGKPVITATQMLESMIQNPRPTRAECSDVANACLDGTDAVMLSGETANGPNYEAAVKVMARVCCEAESSRNYDLMYISVRNSILQAYSHLSVGESIASSAVKTSIDISAKVIVVISETGKMANYVAKFRPGVPILCLTPNVTAARQASGLLLGVHTVVVDSVLEGDELLEEISYELTHSGMLQEGEKIVAIAGRRSTNLKEQLEVVSLTKGKSHGHIKAAAGGSFFFNRSMLLNFSNEN